jgi:OOP family OmpA-OmpF porin
MESVNMFPTKLLGALAALTLLSGCAGFGVGYDIENMRNATASGTPFTEALSDEYRQITLFEADEMYDWQDAGYFAQKGLRASSGEVVLPEEISAWNLPADKVGELTDARGRLMTALDSGARQDKPATAAHAQGRFDCWIEQQEENFQWDHIAACRDEFFAALAELEAAPAAAPAPAPAPVAAPAPTPVDAPKPFVLLFDFDSSSVRGGDFRKIDEAVAAAGALADAEFAVTGHADRAGSEEYNIDLSIKRADAVRAALIERGIPAEDISVAGRGEAETAVPTPDGVREPANRRVEVIIQ